MRRSALLVATALLLIAAQGPTPRAQGQPAASVRASRPEPTANAPSTQSQTPGAQSPESSPQPPVFTRAPLFEAPRALLPVGAIRPRGWLKRQLEIQAAGLTGHLHEIWPDVGPKSGWLGGDGESWERGPYFLDGLVPLAWLLDDARLKATAQAFIEWTLTNQQPDGWIGPRRNTDWWPNFVILKVLTQYYEATGDPRVIPALRKYFAHHLAAGEGEAAPAVGRLPVGRRARHRALALQPHGGSRAARSRADAPRPGRRLEEVVPGVPLHGEGHAGADRAEARASACFPTGRCSRTA